MKAYTVVLADCDHLFPVCHVSADSVDAAIAAARREMEPQGLDDEPALTDAELASFFEMVAVFEGHHVAIA